jgi:predicted PurR-regulated permease PerM
MMSGKPDQSRASAATPDNLAEHPDVLQAAADSGTLTQEQAEHRMRATVDAAETMAERTGGLGQPGRPLNKRSPFFIGMAAAAGVAVTYGLAELIIRARGVLILTGLALFIAAGLDPLVSWLTRRRVPRWAAVIIIVLAAAGIGAAFIAAAIPPLSAQIAALTQHLPGYLHTLQNHNTELGKLNTRYHLQKDLTNLIHTKGVALIGGVLGAGELVLSAVGSVFVVAVLTIYFLAGMPQIKLFAYRLAPHSRRTRVILIGDEIFAKIGGFLLGNFLTSAVAGVGTYIWMLIFGIPYPILLALLVALFDLVPVIGSTIGGAIVTLAALTVSLPVAIATAGFYVAYRLAEDYLLVPRVMGRVVQIPGVITILALLVGGALMGIIGALVAIPAAAAIRLLLHEVTFRRLDVS